MNTETSVKVNYVGFTRRIVAEILDLIIFFPDFIFAFIYGVFIASLEDQDFFQELEQLATKIPFVVFTVVATLTLTISKILMVTKLGGTPGKLLCGMHIKDANTFTNATLIQATIRWISKGSIWIIFRFLLHLHYHGYTFLYLLIVLILFLFAVFDQRKQAFYDRQCMDKNVNYSTMTRRILAFIVDCILFIAIPFALIAVGFSLTHVIQGIMGAIIVITTIVFSLFLMIPCIFHIFMLVKFGGTLGHLLFSMRVRDKDTLEQITLIQAIKRTIAFFIIYCISLYNPILLLAILILVLVCAVDDEHKQAFHDKIANTVVIDYKPS